MLAWGSIVFKGWMRVVDLQHHGLGHRCRAGRLRLIVAARQTRGAVTIATTGSPWRTESCLFGDVH